MCRFFHLPVRLKTPQPSGSVPTYHLLPWDVTLQRASGGSRSRHASLYVSSAITYWLLCPNPCGKKQSFPFRCRPPRGTGELRLAGFAGSGSSQTYFGGYTVPFGTYASRNSPCALSTTSNARAGSQDRSSMVATTVRTSDERRW